MDHTRTLRTVPMLRELPSEDLLGVAQTLAKRSYPAGTQIFAQGDMGDAMYIVSSGTIDIFLPGTYGRRVSLKHVGRGEFFGELALFDAKPRSASALATTDAVLYELRRDVLADFLGNHPGSAMAIMRTMSERIRE